MVYKGGVSLTNDEKILEIRDVHTGFSIGGEIYDAVDGVSLDLYRNEILAIVGESGCGKSTLATTIMGLHNMNYTEVSGEIIYHGDNILEYDEAKYNKIRGGDFGMIFQDPLGALNPLMRISEQIEEGLIYHTDLDQKGRKARVLELLAQVGIENPERTARQFPHQLSGGMRQRVIIAIALACKPEIIIADEPTTALDVTIQAQILDLIKDTQEEMGSGILFITHDLGVVAQTADRVAVMYAGQIIEIAPVKELFNNPQHPYTRSLLNSVPQTEHEGDLHVIQGMVPSLRDLPREGCRFADRIPWIPEEAHEENPTLHKVGEDHYVRCTCYKNFYFEEEVE